MLPGWNFWFSGAIKRLCKFLLKKKLGEVILGDIDLDQLELQLSSGAGTFQLFDLALNVDFLNQKLAGAPVVIKEGSIKSLSVKLSPWKLKNCEIEVNELELVLGPFVGSSMPGADAVDGLLPSHKDEQHEAPNADTTEEDQNSGIPMDVHEGVKTIAKIVKWFLTSFHIRLNRMIIAFDPESDLGMSHKSLVLRIKGIEFGTCVSEDPTPMAKLTNFVKLQEANIEFLEMNDVDDGLELPSASGTDFKERYLGHSTTTVLTGPNGGFSGMVNLSIPWKNGSLDIHKFDADISLDPMELKVQPSSIAWFIATWQSLNKAGTSRSTHILKPRDSFISRSKSYGRARLLNSASFGASIGTTREESELKGVHSTISQERIPDALLTMTHVIHNWVPEPFYQEDQHGLDESIDQFFECFDELRSSQEYSGNSGIWNWTYSVFNAITVASNLASGSGDIPKEQHVETSLRAVVAQISVFLSLDDEKLSQVSNNLVDPSLNAVSSESYMSCVSSMKIDDPRLTEVNLVNQKIHHIEARCQDVVLHLQIYPQVMKIGASVKHIEVDGYYVNPKYDDGQSHDYNDANEHMLLFHYLQEEIQKALPPFPFSMGYFDSESDAKDNASKSLIQVRLLESFGECNCKCNVSKDSNDRRLAFTSFLIHLPPFVFLVHYNLVNMLLDLIKLAEYSIEKSNITKDLPSNTPSERSKFSSLPVAEIGAPSDGTRMYSGASIHGTIILPQARVILWFPFEYYGDSRSSSFSEKFLVLEHSPHLGQGEFSNLFGVPKANSARESSLMTSRSIHFGIHNCDIYLVESATEKDVVDSISKSDKQLFSAIKILSFTTRKEESRSGFTMLWQNGPVTGRWVADRAWSLSSLHGKSSKVNGKGNEFFSVTNVEDLEETSSNIRQELILSSAFLFHIELSYLGINLENHAYKMLFSLVNHVVDGVSRGANENGRAMNKGTKSGELPASCYDATQASIFVECDILDICITLDEVMEVSHLLQKELQGSWNHFKMKVEKFEVLTVSNIGGIQDANYFSLSHGEGELWGSIFNRNAQASKASDDLLLLICKNSSARRGNGEGANALSFGSAGTAITVLQNPQSQERYISITVRCGTVIAPGGRLDWISSVCLYFSLTPTERSENDGMHNKSSESGPACNTSFFMDFLDVAISYEPHKEQFRESSEDPYLECSSAVDPDEGTCSEYTGCLLAVASLSLSSLTMSGPSFDCNICLRDLGLLICESTGKINNAIDYCVGYLQKAGYAKVAQVAVLQAVLRIRENSWEIEFLDSHVNLESCHDTTYGLMRLIDQLQQLYAPDIENALVHLQSRWSTVQQARKDQSRSNTSDIATESTGSGSEVLLAIDESCQTGLLDGILDNAFKNEPLSDQGNHLSHGSLECNNEDKLNVKDPKNVNAVATSRMHASSSCMNEACSPFIIEGYYTSDSLPSSRLSVSGQCLSEHSDTILDASARRETEYGRGMWYKDDYFTVVENHILSTQSQPGGEHLEGKGFGNVTSDDGNYCLPKGRIFLKNMDIRWSMYAGLDWSKPTEVPGSSLTSNDRDESACLDLSLLGLNFQFDIYAEGEINVSKLSIYIQDFHLQDKSRDAPWKMILGNYHSKDHPRDTHAKAIKLNLEAVRPDPLIPLEDYRLHLEFLPLRLHLDQTQLNFLVSFFGKSSFDDQSPSLPNGLEDSEISMTKGRKFGSQTVSEEALLPFFQKCDVRPLVVRVDYVPRHFSPAALKRGNYAELLNLVPWKGIDLHLKQVSAVGVYGWNNVCETIAGEWLEDIAHNQVPKLLKGLAPVRSLYAVSSGTSKLVSLPVKSYKKDQKLIKGMQRGALAFVRSISLEAVGLGVHLAAGAHEVLLQTEYILESIPKSVPVSEMKKKRTSVRSNQPEDAQEGIQQAYESLSDGFGRTASALFGTPLKAYQRGAGAGSALATAIKGAPAAAIAPLSASARAVHCTLLGFRNSLDPDHKKESMEKYSGSQT